MPRKNRKHGATGEFGGGRLMALEAELHARQRARWGRASEDQDEGEPRQQESQRTVLAGRADRWQVR